MGLVVAGASALYLMFSIAVVIGAIKYAKKNGGNAKRWGWKFWLAIDHCPRYSENSREFGVYRAIVKRPQDERNSNIFIQTQLALMNQVESSLRASRDCMSLRPSAIR